MHRLPRLGRAGLDLFLGDSCSDVCLPFRPRKALTIAKRIFFFFSLYPLANCVGGLVLSNVGQDAVIIIPSSHLCPIKYLLEKRPSWQLDTVLPPKSSSELNSRRGEHWLDFGQKVSDQKDTSNRYAPIYRPPPGEYRRPCHCGSWVRQQPIDQLQRIFPALIYSELRIRHNLVTVLWREDTPCMKLAL
ncbi:hypothetical protein VUR80DRAFT_8130 [Thermomyces stellatus]